MAASPEVVLTSEESGLQFSVCVWDVNTGASLVTYKGGTCFPRTLCLLKNEYLITAVINKPLLHVWSIHKKDQIFQKIVCPGSITALTVTKDGSYCAGAVSEKVFIWEVCSGKLLTVLTRHFQTIRCLKFTDNCSHLVSGADDTLALVWQFGMILNSICDRSSDVEPLYTWTHHSLPISDIHVGAGGSRVRVATSSIDHTCKLYELATGRLLLSIVYDTSITSVSLDLAEYCLFAGAADGRIFRTNLYEQPLQSGKEVDDEKFMYTAHSKRVTCLSVSMDGAILLSGSDDCTARLWDIHSRQCLRVLYHKCPVTNALIAATPPSIANSSYSSVRPLPFRPFKKQMADDSERDLLYVRTKSSFEIAIPVATHYEELTASNESESKTEEQQVIVQDSEERVASLEQEIASLKNINKELYNFAANQILKD